MSHIGLVDQTSRHDLTSEKTPLVLSLLEVIQSQARDIQLLKEEIARLKNHPSKPKLLPSKISTSDKRVASDNKKPSKKKSKNIEIHNFERVHPKNLPKGASLIYYKNYTVQDIELKPNNTRYRLGVYRLPDGSLQIADLPQGVDSHFGSNLKAHMLYLYYKANMTQPTLLEYLRENGVKISSAQVSRILTEGHDVFHKEKEAMLKKAMEVSNYFVVDDTGHRHKGKNGYCTHIGNELFTYFKSSESKNRLNFLQILCVNGKSYHLNGFSFDYMKSQRFPSVDISRLKRNNGMKFDNEFLWLQFLKSQSISFQHHIKIATEAALYGFLLTSGLLNHLVFVSDEAGQFNIFNHGLCWVHAERKLTNLIPNSEEQKSLVEKVLTAFWQLYDQLKRYKQNPNIILRVRLEESYDKIFAPSTKWKALNQVLSSFQKNHNRLLKVL